MSGRRIHERQADECEWQGVGRAQCTNGSKLRPKNGTQNGGCKSFDETEEEDGPAPCGSGKNRDGSPCTKYCDSSICVPRC